MTLVCNGYGVKVSFEQAVELMDFDIREEIHMSGECENPQEFFDKYCEKHEESYGVPFELDKPNPIY